MSFDRHFSRNVQAVDTPDVFIMFLIKMFRPFIRKMSFDRHFSKNVQAVHTPDVFIMFQAVDMPDVSHAHVQHHVQGFMGMNPLKKIA